MKISNLLEHIFFPYDACCINCKYEHIYKYALCRECFDDLSVPDGERCEICLDKINTEGLCKECFEEAPEYRRLYAPFVYEGTIKKLILTFKYHGRKYLRHPFGQMLLDALPEDILHETEIIVPVPSSSDRIKEHGYNHSELLARELSELSGIPVNTVTLKKLPGQIHMTSLNKAERRKNVRGYYYLDGNLNGESVLLVDDVATTGETLRECAMLLHQAGAREIYCAVLARTDKHFD